MPTTVNVNGVPNIVESQGKLGVFAMLKKIGLGFLGLVVVLGVIFALGPREEVDEPIRISAEAIGNDIETYLAEAEAKFDDIKRGAEKRIIWDSDIA